VAKKRRPAGPARRRLGADAAAIPRPDSRAGSDPGALAAALCLAAVLAATALAVDTSAAASFDAPKRLAAMLGAALASAAVFLWPSAAEGARSPGEILGRGARRAAAVLLAAAIVL